MTDPSGAERALSSAASKIEVAMLLAMADFYPVDDEADVERVPTTVRLRPITHEDIKLIAEIWNELDVALKKKRTTKWKASSTIEQIIEVGVQSIWEKYGGRPADKKARAEFVKRAVEAIRSKS